MESVFGSSAVLMDAGTRLVWSRPPLKSLPPLKEGKAGLLATLWPAGEADLGFAFRLRPLVLIHFLPASPEDRITVSGFLPKPTLAPPLPPPTPEKKAEEGTPAESQSPSGRWHPCRRCGKSFARKEELTRHSRIHSGLRPYQCPVCDKRFGRKDHLNKHARVHVSRAQDPIFQRAVCSYFAHLAKRK